LDDPFHVSIYESKIYAVSDQTDAMIQASNEKDQPFVLTQSSINRNGKVSCFASSVAETKCIRNIVLYSKIHDVAIMYVFQNTDTIYQEIADLIILALT
jgi:hypothetical protein